jgi:hypothetical protein
MQLPKGSGIEALDRMVRRSVRFWSDQFSKDQFRRSMTSALKKLPTIELPSLADLRKPVDNFVKSLNNVVAQLTYKPEKIDYRNIVNSFLPPGAKLIKPQYPEQAGEIQFVDLDGDGRSELVASYITGDGIRTLVLKKDEVQWYKMAEVSSPGYSGIHYRTSADISGEGKKDLLLGLVRDQQGKMLFAYSLSDGSSKKIFSRKYDKLEVLRNSPRVSGDAVALWHEETPGIHNIELIRWNGIDIEQLDKTRYLASRVLPYYIRKLRQDPSDTAGWYNLAGTFMDAGDRVNAAKAIRYALEFDPDPAMRDRLMELRQKL